MKTHPNTYDLLVASNSEDRGRSLAETLICALLILSAVVSIIASAAQTVAVPSRIALKDCKTAYCA